MDTISQNILKYLQEIPKGKLMSYKTLGEKFCVHPRKVAMTMKYNPYPELYPCYKVIAHSGKISGYSGTGGVQGKIARIIADGIPVKEGSVEKKYIL